jgi:hypothetical protein
MQLRGGCEDIHTVHRDWFTTTRYLNDVGHMEWSGL